MCLLVIRLAGRRPGVEFCRLVARWAQGWFLGSYPVSGCGNFRCSLRIADEPLPDSELCNHTPAWVLAIVAWAAAA